MKSRTLEEIIRAEQSHRHEGGQFGINACKESIRFSVEYLGENLADLLNEYVERANADAFFNKAMVLACWELMQEAEADFAETEEEPTEEASADPVEVFNEAHNSIIEDKSGNRSAWGRGVTAYALELLDSIEEAIKGGWLPLDELETAKGRKAAMLNGASDWDQFSWGGCSLIYDSDIAERLCTPSELKRTRGGELRPNPREEWLDTQARALNQAANRASRALRQALEKRA